MRVTPSLGIPFVATVMLLAGIACPRPMVARPSALAVEAVPNPEAAPPLAEPVTELPLNPAPQIEAINLFPNQAEMAPGARFNDQRFGYVLHGEVRATYESNLFIQPDHRQEDFSFRISPGVAFGWGEFKSELHGWETFRHRFDSYAGKNYIYADYSPSYTWYVDHGDLDSLDHDARLEGEWSFQRLTIGARASYVSEKVPVEDIGTRVEQKRLNAALTTRYQYSGMISFDINGFYDGLDFGGNGLGSREWRNEDWMDFQISPKIRLGFGGAIAFVEREAEASQNYEQARWRLIYEASEKLTLGLLGGAEWRHAEGEDNRTDGVFQLDVTWSPFDGTCLYLRGFRQSVTGNTEGSDYNVVTGVYAQYRQRLFHRFFVELAAGYQNAEFQDAAGTPNFGRSDDLFFVRPGIGFDLATWLNCEITGEYRQNDSNDEQFGYEATNATVRFNLLF